MKIRRNAWHGWVRCGLKITLVAGALYGLFGYWLGIKRIVGNDVMNDGDIVLFDRLANNFGAEDVLVMGDGSLATLNNRTSGRIEGKVIARFSVRNFNANANDN